MKKIIYIAINILKIMEILLHEVRILLDSLIFD